jgi:dTMP kinase
MERGLFIVFEGGEGAGKSTQSDLLARWVDEQGRSVTRTREPGGTPAAEAIREVLLDVGNTGLDDRAEALLFAAARGDHAMRVIRPALERGDVVVCDRYLDSSVAYQGAGRGLGLDAVRDLSLWATRDLIPDLTIILDVDPGIGLSRVERPDRLESEPLEWHARVRHAFLDLAAREPQRYLVIDGGAGAEEIAARVSDRVRHLLDS